MDGGGLRSTWSMPQDWWFALILFFVLRPIATYFALWLSDITPLQKYFIAFFGIRGIGSLYYLSYAIGEGLSKPVAEQLGGIVQTTIALSLLIHSNIASPMLAYYATNKRS